MGSAMQCSVEQPLQPWWVSASLLVPDLWGLASGLLIGWVARKRIIGADAAIGVITTGSFAFGLALQARFGQASRNIEAVLFGNVLGVFTSDIWAVVAVTVVAL
jgi:ABC-type Mn2+/Zn2+ transport system permease subunit